MKKLTKEEFRAFLEAIRKNAEVVDKMDPSKHFITRPQLIEFIIEAFERIE